MTGPPFALHPPPAPGELLDLPPLAEYRSVLEDIRRHGGRPLLVGGCVRDLLLNGEFQPLDVDLEVQALEPGTLRAILLSAGGHERGKSFAVFGLGPLEFALPRRERKTGPGHKGFDVEADPDLPFPLASARRDVTINSMGFDPWTGEILDPHGGRADLAAGILRHTSRRFSEDPLRVLRVMQFAARFCFAVAPSTIELCRSLDLSELPRERLWGEWKKLLLKGRRPSFGLRFLERCGALRFFPELQVLPETPQDPGWHPEGNVWEHTLLALDAAVEFRTGEEEFDLALMLGVLCHDMGKATTTYYDPEKDRIVSPRHEPLGVAPALSFLARLTNETRLTETVAALVARHLAPHQLYKESLKGLDVRPALRRLALKVDPLLLERVARADHFGRRTKDALERNFPAGDFFLREIQALELEEKKPAPIVMGRHLLAEGLPPGPEMGRWLKRLFQAQLDGEFDTLEEGLALFRKWRPRPPGD